MGRAKGYPKMQVDGQLDILLCVFSFITFASNAKRYMNILGMHPRVLVDGFEIAKRATLQFLEKFKTPVVMGDEPDKEILKMVARTTVRTKVSFISFHLCFR